MEMMIEEAIGVMDMEDDKVAEIFVGMVADLELDNVVDKVADMEVD